MKLTYSKDDEAPNIELEPHDTWSVDWLLACIIVPLLKQLRDTKHGAPRVDNEDVPEELHCPEGFDDSCGETDEKYFERWDWVLNEMIWTFEQHADWDDDAPYIHNSDNLKMNMTPYGDEGYKSITFEPKDPTKPAYFRDREGLKKHEERKDRGRALFAKYYSHLWD